MWHKGSSSPIIQMHLHSSLVGLVKHISCRFCLILNFLVFPFTPDNQFFLLKPHMHCRASPENHFSLHFSLHTCSAQQESLCIRCVLTCWKMCVCVEGGAVKPDYSKHSMLLHAGIVTQLYTRVAFMFVETDLHCKMQSLTVQQLLEPRTG